MEIRWYVERLTYRNWDDREDEYVITVHKSKPVLQYRDAKDNQWKELPTHYEESGR